MHWETAVDLRQLRYFISIVDEGSVTAAAQRLNIAQPALSHHLRNLEKDLGVRLLIRGAHGVRPTVAGARLYEHALTIQRQFNQALNEVRGYADEPHGPVTIGLPASVALVLAVPLIETVRRQFPKVSLRVMEGMSGNILEWLNNGRLDLALLYDASYSKSLVTEPLLTENLYLIGPPGASNTDIPFNDIPNHPLIMPGRPHGLREQIEKAARNAGIVLNVTAEIDGLPQIKTLVARGVGFAVLSLSAVRDEWQAQAVEARLVVDPMLERTVSLTYPKSLPLSEAAEAVRSTIYRVMQDLIGRDIWLGKALF